MTLAATTSQATAHAVATWTSRLLERVTQLSPAAPRSGKLDTTSCAQIRTAGGGRITCVTGSLWVTCDGEAADTVLEAGQSMVCQESQSVMITAFQPSSWRSN